MITSITRKTSSLFFAIVLVVGVITITITPSFIIEANAQSAYGMYNYKEPKVIIEKLECNNDNINIDIANPAIESQVQDEVQKLLAQYKSADQKEKSYFDEKITLICTNDNNKIKFPVSADNEQSLTVQSSNNLQTLQKQQQQQESEVQVVGCEQCLKKLGNELQTQLMTSIDNLANPVMKIGDVSIDFSGIITTSTNEDLCPVINTAVKTDGPILMSDIISAVNNLIPSLNSEDRGLIADVLVCLLKTNLLELDSGITVT